MMLDVYFEAGAALGEGPVWHTGLAELHYVDIDAGAICRVQRQTDPPVVVTLGEAVGSAVPTRDGLAWIAGTRSGVSLVSLSGEILRHVNVDVRAGHRMNDGGCDARGRFWTGTLNEEPEPPCDIVYRVDADWRITAIHHEVGLSNGLDWSPDARTMYRVDSSRRVVLAADFDLAYGEVENERSLVDLSDGIAEPDGLAVDADGAIWVAMWDGWAVHRYDPAGRLMSTIDLPVSRPTSLAFGGSSLDTLFVTSAAVGLTDGELKLQPHAGDIFCADVGVSGLVPNYFGE